MTRHSGRRSAFTLIEVIAAIAISSILFAALYATIELMLGAIRMGKENVASLQIVRGTVIRLGTDIRHSLALLATTPSVQDALAAASDPNYTPPDPAPTQINYGMKGDAASLQIFGCRLPRYSRDEAEMPNPQGLFADLRTVNYFVQQEGLVRQETVNVLGESSTDDGTLVEVLAPEVTNIQFQYWDSTSNTWQQQWDGTVNGPPAAIEITLTIQMPDKPGMPPHEPLTHRFVVAIPTFGSPALGVTQP